MSCRNRTDFFDTSVCTVQISIGKRPQQRGYVRLILFGSQLAKVRRSTTAGYSRAAHVINSVRWLVVVRQWLATETVINDGVYYWPRLCILALSNVFRSCSGFCCHLLYHISGWKDLITLLPPRSCERLPPDNFFALLVTRHGRSLRPSPLSWTRRYFQVVKNDTFDFLRRASVSFILRAPFQWSFLQCITAQNISISGSSHRWTEGTLGFQEKSPLAHLSVGLAVRKLVSRIAVEKEHITDEHRRI